VTVSDDEGVAVILTHLVDEVATDAAEQEQWGQIAEVAGVKPE